MILPDKLFCRTLVLHINPKYSKIFGIAVRALYVSNLWAKIQIKIRTAKRFGQIFLIK